MMRDTYEIRIHGRGGQGAKTAAHILATSALKDQYFIQAFPEFGPERGGAPVKAFLRISKTPILEHDSIKEPDLVAVIDPNLIQSKELILEGLSADKKLIVNTNKTPDQIAMELNFKGEIYTVDATKISLECLGKSMPNTPMLGTIAKISGMFNLSSMKKEFENIFLQKIGKDLVKKNLDALERGFSEVHE